MTIKPIACLCLSLLLVGCSNSTGKEEKELATQAFIDCDFYTAKSTAKLAIEYADGDVEVVVPALLIIGKSAEILGQESDAYEEIVTLAPGINSTVEAKAIVDCFVDSLSKAAPDKVKACSELQG